MTSLLVTMVMKVDSSVEPENFVPLNNGETSATTRRFCIPMFVPTPPRTKISSLLCSFGKNWSNDKLALFWEIMDPPLSSERQYCQTDWIFKQATVVPCSDESREPLSILNLPHSANTFDKYPIFTDHLCSTREGNVFTHACLSMVGRGGGRKGGAPGTCSMMP